MSAILLPEAEKQSVQKLRCQLKEGLLQGGMYQCAESYLIGKKIYDVTLIEQEDFSGFAKFLKDKGQYTEKQVREGAAMLRSTCKYWVQEEYGTLMNEIDQCAEAEGALKSNIKRFLIRKGIHHIREIDYQVRQRYERELLETRRYEQTLRYLKAFDRIKQYDIKKRNTGIRKSRKPYKNQILFLPYLDDQVLARDFEWVQDKNELVWDFLQTAPKQLKKQVFTLLHYFLENIKDPKDRRVRFLLPLQWMYQFCIQEGIENIAYMEAVQIERLEADIAQKVVSVKNSMQIVDNSRKILFLQAKEIHWEANVWYTERFHLSQARLNPSNPVHRLSFLEVENPKNRALLKEYLRYEVGITDLAITTIHQQLRYLKCFMKAFEKTGPIYAVPSEQLDSYFRQLQEEVKKPESFNKWVLSITKFYHYLKTEKYIDNIPFAPEYYFKKELHVHHDRSVEEQTCMEILRKLHLFPEISRLIFLHLWCTGLRISEVCTLKGDAYYWDGEDAWLKVYQVKLRADKMIPIPLILYKTMETYINKYHIKSKDYIFSSPNSGAYRSGSFRKTFQNNCKKYGIENGTYLFKSHDYRHALATRFYDDGVSMQTVRDYLGHFSEDMTKQYIDFMPKKIAEANDAYFGKSGNSLGAAIAIKKRGENVEKKNSPV